MHVLFYIFLHFLSIEYCGKTRKITAAFLRSRQTVEVNGDDAAVSGVILDVVWAVEMAETIAVLLALTVRPNGRHVRVHHCVICLLRR